MKGTDALILLIRSLEDAAAPYMIVGSYSSNFYGIPRSTKDADLVVNLEHDETLDLLAEAKTEAAPAWEDL